MKFLAVLSVSAAFLWGGSDAFVANSPGAATRHYSPTTTSTTTSLSMKNNNNNFDADAYARSMSSAAIDQMKNLKPEDLDKMIAEIDNMGGMQKAALKAMNMDTEMMKKSLQMMKDNPAMIANAQKVMESMTPDEMLEQSRKAQEQLKNMTPEQLDAMQSAVKDIPADQLSAAADVLKEQKAKASANANGVIDAELEDDDDDDAEEKVVYTGPGSSVDSKVIDAMFQVAQYMSDATESGVTFAGFSSLPIIQLLSGDREFDLSRAELKECWANGSLGATRVDRTGFGRVWTEVQEYFEDDVMTEARKEAKKRASPKKRGSSKSTKTIGEDLNADQLKAVNDKVKNLSPDEVGSVLDMMEKMDPAQEARLKAMGVDPAIMRKTAEMLKENPQMREQAQKMMENMSPEDMLKASQQAQEQMKGMSQADIDRAMAELKNQKTL